MFSEAISLWIRVKGIRWKTFGKKHFYNNIERENYEKYRIWNFYLEYKDFGGRKSLTLMLSGYPSYVGSLHIRHWTYQFLLQNVRFKNCCSVGWYKWGEKEKEIRFVSTTYWIVADWCSRYSDRGESGWLWWRCLHIIGDVLCIRRIINFGQRTWWGIRGSVSCSVSRLMRGCWWCKTLCRHCLIIAHNCEVSEYNF